MKLEHKDTFVESQLLGLAQINARRDSRIFTNCPFCNDIPEDNNEDNTDPKLSGDQDALQIHVSQHLKSLALLSLTWLEGSISEAQSENDHLLSSKERSASVNFADPPTHQIFTTADDVDKDWAGVLPVVSEIGDERAVFERLHENYTPLSRDREWCFCYGSLPHYEEYWKDDTLANFVERWRNEAADSGEKILKAASGFWPAGKDIILSSLDRRSPGFPTLEELLKAAAGNEQNGKEILTLLVDSAGSDLQVTEEVLKAAAGNLTNGEELLSLLANYTGSEIQITEEVLKAAAGNQQNGKEVLALLFKLAGSNIQVTEEVLRAAVTNEENGRDI